MTETIKGHGLDYCPGCIIPTVNRDLYNPCGGVYNASTKTCIVDQQSRTKKSQIQIEA